jgi:branched-chain amino acid transport system permease protein
VDAIIQHFIQGVPFGCVYALLAIGLVLTYRTAGVFNLAFAAQAFLSAAVFYDMRSRHNVPTIVAFVVAVLIVAPLVGLILERGLFQYQRGTPEIGRLVTSLGLLVALPQIVIWWFGGSSAYSPPSLAPNPFTVYHPFGGKYPIDQNQVFTMGITLVVVIGLSLLFKYTAIGLRMRAVVESPRLAELSGVNADRTSAFAWMLSSAFAGLAGVLLAPLSASLNYPDIFTLLVAAIAAACFASLRSIPMALLGGIGLSVLQEEVSQYLPTNSVFAGGLKAAVPFIILFILLLFWPGLRKSSRTTDPLAGVDAPPKGFASLDRSPLFTRLTYGLGLIAAAGVVYLVFAQMNAYWLTLVTQTVIFGIIFLSITVITGMTGQVSLCQPVFAAIGGFATAHFAVDMGVSVLVGVIIGAVFAAIVGGLLAIPSLRLGGIFLSLATVAFALFFQLVMVPLDWLQGAGSITNIPRPIIGPFDFSNDKSYFFFCVVILALVAWLVVRVRNGTTGRFLDAIRGSEVAAASIGISAARARVTAFALSAGIAGLGGGLLAIQKGQITYTETYDIAFALVWVVVVVTLGSRTVEGAIQAAIGFILFPVFLTYLSQWTGQGFFANAGLASILFGFGAFTYAKHPEGILEFQKRTSTARFQALIDRRSAKKQAAVAGDAA